MEDQTPEGAELRAELSTKTIDDLPDSAFAYIEPGGKKDDEGKTVPRDLRHYPVQDKPHADDALARANAALSEGGKAAEIAEKALPAIKAAVKKFAPQSNSATPNWATPKRAFSSLIEQPPPHIGTFEVRMEGDDSPIAHFTGYASTTGTPYSVRDWLGEYTETIMPGAFAKTLREQDNIPLLFNHDGIPLASTGSGTSRLSEDAKGLRNEAELDRRDALTNSVCVQLARGVLNKMSFSFRATKDTWNEAYDDRGVNEAALYDSSIVTFPANPATSGELVDAMRSALGREGRSLWLAESELSVRSLLPAVVEARELPADGDDLLERAVRALAHADEVLARQQGLHGRARTFHVVGALLELRAGKTLSAKNQALLQQAADSLAAGDRSHAKAAEHHAAAASALNAVLSPGDSGDATAENQGPQQGDVVAPADGAGPRSLPPSVLQARRQLERLKRGR